MFKKGFSTVACMETSYWDIIKACLTHGIEGVEIRLGSDGSVCGLDSSDELEKLKGNFAANGLVITDLGSSACFAQYNTNALAAAQLAVDRAVTVNSKAIRVFLGNFSTKVNPDKPEPDYNGIVRALKELCDYAKNRNIEIWIETHNEFATGRVLKRLLADVDKDNMKIIWDVIHPIEDGENIEETWNAIGGRIAHIHIKDGFDRMDPMWHDYEYTCLGEGALPLYSLFDLLRETDYKGYLSFEWETAWRTELKRLPQNLDYVLKQYNSLFEGYEKNKIHGFDNGWKCYDAASGDRTDAVLLSEHKAMTELIVDEKNPALKKYEYITDIEKNAAYKISVPFEAEETASRIAAYALVSLYDEEGTAKRRLYLNRPVHNRLELIFRSEGETSVKLELGLKHAGRVKWYRPSLLECEPLPERKVRIGAVHMTVQSGISYEENLRRVEEAFDNAANKGADILAFAETIGDRGTTLDADRVFESIDGPFFTLMKRKASEHKCYVFFTFHEKDENGVKHNTAILLDRNGETVGRYIKSHQALAEFERGMVPGDSYPVFETEFGKIGMLICWDAYFPEPARAMTFKGAEILFVSTAGNPTYRHIARAKENGVYVVVACAAQNGDSEILPTKIINPCGEILAHTNTDKEAAFAEIDLNKNDYIFWLSVGGANTTPNSIYMNEYRDDLYGLIDNK